MKPLDREYVGRGIVVTVEEEDDLFYVWISDPKVDDPIKHSVSYRKRPALRKFAAVVAQMKEENQ